MHNQAKKRLLRKTPLPLDTVRIGRWAPNVSYPHHGYWDPVADVTPLVHETAQQRFKQIYEEAEGAGRNLQGTVLACGSSKRHNHSSDEVSTDLSTVYQLDNPEKWFDDAIQRQVNRAWIEKALKAYGRLYMIIGYQTVQDARIQGVAQHSKESSITL